MLPSKLPPKDNIPPPPSSPSSMPLTLLKPYDPSNPLSPNSRKLDLPYANTLLDPGSSSPTQAGTTGTPDDSSAIKAVDQRNQATTSRTAILYRGTGPFAKPATPLNSQQPPAKTDSSTPVDSSSTDSSAYRPGSPTSY